MLMSSHRRKKIIDSLFDDEQYNRRKTALLHLKDDDINIARLSKYVLHHEEIMKLMDKANKK